MRKMPVFIEARYKHVRRDQDLIALPYDNRAYRGLFATLHMTEARALAVGVPIHTHVSSIEILRCFGSIGDD